LIAEEPALSPLLSLSMRRPELVEGGLSMSLLSEAKRARSEAFTERVESGLCNTPDRRLLGSVRRPSPNEEPLLGKVS